MPSIFISHGAPNMIIHGGPTHDFLQGLGGRFEKPKGIMVVSAHWETDEPMLTAHPRPETIYDFYGFERDMYKMKYEAAGAPELAEKACAVLPLATLDPDRGLDHGAWSPLKIAYPQAEIPVFQLSVQPHKDAAWHYNIGKHLSGLRDEGVLIMASGNATHNLRAAFGGDAYSGEKAEGFSNWLHRALTTEDHEQAQQWEKAGPDAAWNHPTPEHFLPLFVALGASHAEKRSERIHEGIEFNALAMDAYRFS